MTDIGAFFPVQASVELYDFSASVPEKDFCGGAASLFMIGADQRNIPGPVSVHADNRFPITAGKARNRIHTGDQAVHGLFFKHIHEFDLTVHDIYGIAGDAFIIMSGQLKFDTAHHSSKERMLQTRDNYAHQTCFPAG